MVRTNRSGPVVLGDALKRMLGRMDKKGQLSKRSAADVWDDVVGEKISTHTAVLSARGSELVIGVDSAAWANELSLMADSLLEKVNSETGNESLTRIRFTVSRGVETRRAEEESIEFSAGRHAARKVVPQPLDDDEMAAVERSLEAISDRELRKTARRATVRDLERKKGMDTAKSPQNASDGL